MQHASTYDNFLSFVYREDLKILFLRWLMKVNSEKLRAGYEAALQKALEFETAYWLVDLRGRGPVSEEDEAWVANNFFPMAEENFKTTNYFAYLVAPSHQQHFQENGKVDILKSNPSPSLSAFNIFTAENEAIEWLLSWQK